MSAVRSTSANCSRPSGWSCRLTSAPWNRRNRPGPRCRGGPSRTRPRPRTDRAPDRGTVATTATTVTTAARSAGVLGRRGPGPVPARLGAPAAAPGGNGRAASSSPGTRHAHAGPAVHPARPRCRGRHAGSADRDRRGGRHLDGDGRRRRLVPGGGPAGATVATVRLAAVHPRRGTRHRARMGPDRRQPRAGRGRLPGAVHQFVDALSAARRSWRNRRRTRRARRPCRCRAARSRRTIPSPG
jgi:hypothetical protein